MAGQQLMTTLSKNADMIYMKQVYGCIVLDTRALIGSTSVHIPNGHLLVSSFCLFFFTFLQLIEYDSVNEGTVICQRSYDSVISKFSS